MRIKVSRYGSVNVSVGRYLFASVSPFQIPNGRQLYGCFVVFRDNQVIFRV